MSIKDLFGKSADRVVSSQQVQNLYDEAESEGFLDEISKDNQRFLPSVDFSSASNFAKYGSAEKYYVDAIKNIYQRYPYDGSKKEKLEWRNLSSQIDLYIFDYVYPKSLGYVTLNSSLNQYITVNGGPHTSSTGKFSDANIYDISKNRESNLSLNSLNLGNTVEFWYKQEAGSSSSYALFDLWNGETQGSNNYTRFLIEKNNDGFAVTYLSGTSGVASASLAYLHSITNWHHYAFTVKSENSALSIKLYVDGDLQKTISTGSAIAQSADNASLVANLGAYRTGSAAYASGSFDEFRYWKERTSKNISRFWFTSVGGGSNTDDSNTELGVYFKFNEGIVSTASINSLDSQCLDYSGRISNGKIVNYTLGARNTGSAIQQYNSDFSEDADPILYPTHPQVLETLETYANSGSVYDTNNNSSIYKSLPSWITEEAENNGGQDLSNLVQIISSYFDTLHLQIEALPRIKDIKYFKDSEKPLPFINKILSSYDFENVDIFTNSTFLEDVLSRNETQEFEKSLNDVKNTIYQNIYNNLTYIYKSKGTEKSLRNLIRCFGVDDELIKINLYADNAIYEIKDKYNFVSSPKKFVDFNNPDRYTGVIYQKSISGDSGTRGYIKGNSSGKLDYIPITVQAEVIFPKKPAYDDPNYDIPNFSTVSLFGVHTANSNDSILTWGSDEFNFQVYAEKRDLESKDAYFRISGSFSGSSFDLSSGWYNEIYNNTKWNLAVRVKQDKFENVDLVSGSSTGSYTLEFVGYNSILDNLENYFIVTASIPSANAKSALSKNKRVYAGAHYSNFDTSSLLAKTDVKISSVRFWLDYLNDQELKAHSFDSSNFGRQYPYWNAFLTNKEANTLTLSKADLLALNWDFNTVTSSNASGQFIVEDASSGSIFASKQYNTSWLGDIIKYRHSGFATEFYENDSQVVNKEYAYSAKLQNPEIITNSELIQVRDSDDINVTRNSKPITYFYSIEKSMSQVINDEIMNWFATIDAFNNLIGDPAERYRKEYKNLSYLRKLFFEKVQNNPDFEKFIEFFKWIDSSISLIISQLVPASANVSSNIRTIIESHLLERNKYENKAPSFEKKGEPVISTLNPLKFNYQEQAAANNPTGSMWLKQRVNRSNPLVTSGFADADANREEIRKVIFRKNLNKVANQYDSTTGVEYQGKEDIVRSFSNFGIITSSLLEKPEAIIRPLNISNDYFSGSVRISGALFSEQDLVTGSGQILEKTIKTGNFLNTYEYVQTSGRTNVNITLADVVDSLDNAQSGTLITDHIERTLVERAKNKAVFVEKFSAPGGAEVNSRGALEETGEEYSPYNEINNRNYVVRRHLNRLYAETGSIDSQNPSYHKVNKNPSRRIAYDANKLAEIKTSYDNQFVVHQIPRSDSQYLWISSSLASGISASGFISEYDNLNVFYSSSHDANGNGYLAEFNFLSGSSESNFVGLNTTNIVITPDTSSNTISANNVSGNLNTYLLNKDGPYGMASWKQIKNADKKLLKISRKNNKLLVQDPPQQKTRIAKGRLEYYIDAKPQAFTSYKEPPVQFNAPMTHLVGVTGSSAPIEIVSTYDNNKDKLANESLSKALGVKERNESQTADVLAELENGIYEPKPKILRKIYRQNIFPKKKDVTSIQVRSKPFYEETDSTASVVDVNTFWKDDVKQREKITGSYDLYGYAAENQNILPISRSFNAYNQNYYPRNNFDGVFSISQNRTYKNSIFSLDSYNDYNNSTVTIATSSLNSSYFLHNVAEYYSGSTFKIDYGIPFELNVELTNSVYSFATNINNQYYIFGGNFIDPFRGNYGLSIYLIEDERWISPDREHIVNTVTPETTAIYKIIPTVDKYYFYAFGNFSLIQNNLLGNDQLAAGAALYRFDEGAVSVLKGELFKEDQTTPATIRTAVKAKIPASVAANYGFTADEVFFVGGDFRNFVSSSTNYGYRRAGLIPIIDESAYQFGRIYRIGTEFGASSQKFGASSGNVTACLSSSYPINFYWNNGGSCEVGSEKGIIFAGNFRDLDIGGACPAATGLALLYVGADKIFGIESLNTWLPGTDYEQAPEVFSLFEDTADADGAFFIGGDFPNEERANCLARWDNANRYIQYLNLNDYLKDQELIPTTKEPGFAVVKDIFSNSSGLYTAVSCSDSGISYIMRYNTTSRATFSGSWSVVKAVSGTINTLGASVNPPTAANPDSLIFAGTFDRSGTDYSIEINLQDSDKFRGYLNNITFLETDYYRRLGIKYILNNLSYFDLSNTNIYNLNGTINNTFTDILKSTSILAFASGSQNEGLYVAGNFSIVCGSVANGVARWHGNNFNRLTSSGGDDLFTNATASEAAEVTVNTLVSSSYYGLVAGGSFSTSSGGAQFNRLARWKDNEWKPFYSSSNYQNDTVYQVITGSYLTASTIIAVGSFTSGSGGGNYAGSLGARRGIDIWVGSQLNPGISFYGLGVFGVEINQ